jgi:DUF4097 and DUF4098 domain-containing protein YvlB
MSSREAPMRHLLVSLLACAACQLTVKAGVEETYEVNTEEKGRASKGVIETPNGDIELEGGGSPKAVIKAMKYASARSVDEARALAEAIKVEAGSGEVFGVRVSLPGDLGPLAAAGADLEIRGPADLAYQIDARNGDVTVRQVRGDVRATSANGDIDVQSDGAAVELSSQNGDLKAVGAFRRVRLDTKNGDAELLLPRLLGDAEIAIDTANGDITVALPEGAALSVELSTANGEILSEGFALPPNKGGRVSGNIGAGGARLTARTSTGDIELIAR